jgi:hypothetical protein
MHLTQPSQGQRMKALLTSLVVIATAACGAGAGGAGGDDDDFEAEFTQACGEFSNLEPELCSCMAGKAQNELSEDERNFLLASIRDDEAETERLRPQLSLDGAMRVGMFMTNVTACGPEAGRP